MDVGWSAVRKECRCCGELMISGELQCEVYQLQGIRQPDYRKK